MELSKQNIKCFILNIILPLFLGLLVYALFRQRDLFLQDLLPSFLNLEVARKAVADVALPEWMIYSLPDGLWLYAFNSFGWMIAKGNARRSAIGLFPFFIAVFSEFAQYFHWICGTFCPVDLFFYFLSAFMAFTRSKSTATNIFNYLKPKLKYALSAAGLLFFVLIAAATNGPADAVQDMYIQDERDPMKKEKMQRIENWYHAHGRRYPTAAQYDSIYRAVESSFAAPDTVQDEARPRKKQRRK